MKLKELKTGQKAVVLGYEPTNGTYRAKLLAMGITKGSTVKLIEVALGDPVKVEVRGYGLSLRKAEADALIVESTQ